MSTTAITGVQIGPGSRGGHAIRSVPFSRLLAVETRKLFDTRSGMILVAIMVAVSLAAMVGRSVALGPNLQATIRISAIGLSTLLPVLGIFSVTSEWSHHTALTTFALEPRRWRVLIAKCVPPVMTALAGCAVAVLSAVGIVVVVANAQGVTPDWSVDPKIIIGWVAVNVIEVLVGVAFGMLLLNAPAAIVLLLTSPLIWTTITRTGDLGTIAAEWLDRNRTTSQLLDLDMTTQGAMRLAVTLTSSIAIPLLAGFLRVARKEVK